jgi:hypothetical protein
MSYTIWKAVLSLTDVQDIEIPENAELLTAREQQDQLCVWFKCDPTKPLRKRRIMIVYTGHSAPEEARYVGTGLLCGGQFVIHVFEQVSCSKSTTTMEDIDASGWTGPECYNPYRRRY